MRWTTAAGHIHQPIRDTKQIVENLLTFARARDRSCSWVAEPRKKKYIRMERPERGKWKKKTWKNMFIELISFTSTWESISSSHVRAPERPIHFWTISEWIGIERWKWKKRHFRCVIFLTWHLKAAIKRKKLQMEKWKNVDSSRNGFILFGCNSVPTARVKYN